MTTQEKSIRKAIRSDLKMFLTSRRLLSTFVRNTDNLNSEFRDFNACILFVSNAFVWDSSPEGHDFWQKIDAEYRLYCERRRKYFKS